MPYKNKEKQKEYLRQYYINNSEKEKEYTRQYYINNREKKKEYMRQYYINNSEKIEEWRKNNPEYLRRWTNKKYKTDTKFNLNNKIGKAIGISLKGNKVGRHWESLVGYILENLIKRLKKTIPEGYNWKDFLNGRLHIDHIIPISVFNFSKPEHIDFKRCWALSNLQLLPAKENRIKHNKLKKPFQPALKI